MIKGAIFDLDGTILDSMYIWDSIGEDYLKSLMIEPKENLKEVFKTFTLSDAANYYIKNYGVTLSSGQIIEGINKLIENYYFNTITLKDGIAGILKKCRMAGIKMCIATVTDANLAKAALKRCGVIEYFSEIFSCSDCMYGKENPYIYRKAAEYLGTKKEETLVFEDSLHAIKTAKKDGFITVGVFDEHEDAWEEIKKNADYIIEGRIKNENSIDRCGK